MPDRPYSYGIESKFSLVSFLLPSYQANLLPVARSSLISEGANSLQKETALVCPGQMQSRQSGYGDRGAGQDSVAPDSAGIASMFLTHVS